MKFRPIIKRSFLAAAGYVLSPLSWWNDLYVNFPIAYGLAWIISLLDARIFSVALVAAYWLTNIAGLIMLHKGLAPAGDVGARPDGKRRKKIAADLIIAAVYTAVIILLLRLGFLKLPQEYLGLIHKLF